ncbi:TPA: hypothetical protein JBF32_00965 [Legionella pneumophila]|uniref:Uncharacterized protein n=1 Tax=Legionella santicrucis TaxID=45074 RepID=A0A0W0Z1B5_9GAMM|nr:MULTISPECIES: hypothetical protein [Legionellaceae]HAU0261040.1 hypothetical protein [Legionella pneumophila]KTD62941.1 hypothetical protein Lsan_1601 [Legionella santicrucis]QLZ67966.1 hypothetical protein FOLKNPGA_00744 [Legionella sp. PC1000]HAU0297306.1 hypothetical protein [Legionella pneumophila]HAU0944740.1 hypothetical protein [Legionella pneumophila]
MDIRTSFYWDAKNKSIHYLICDFTENEFNLLVEPRKIDINLNDFKYNVQKAVREYFDQLNSFNPQDIKIEYKILASGSPAQLFQKYRNSSDYSEIVKTIFETGVKEFNANFSIKLQPQTKSLLTGEPLNQLKNILHRLGLINSMRKDAYKWHLWSIMIHATNSTYNEKIRKQLWKPLIDTLNSSKGSAMRYEEWIAQASINS